MLRVCRECGIGLMLAWRLSCCVISQLATMGHSDSLPPISTHFVSFAWRYHRLSPIRPHRLETGAVDQPGVGKPGSRPAATMETERSRKFP